METTRNKTARILLPCLVIVFCAVLAATVLAGDREKEGPKESVTKWQHLALTHQVKGKAPNADLAKTIVRLGKEGWELVCVENFSESGTTAKTVFYFKRPL